MLFVVQSCLALLFCYFNYSLRLSWLYQSRFCLHLLSYRHFLIICLFLLISLSDHSLTFLVLQFNKSLSFLLTCLFQNQRDTCSVLILKWFKWTMSIIYVIISNISVFINTKVELKWVRFTQRKGRSIRKSVWSLTEKTVFNLVQILILVIKLALILIFRSNYDSKFRIIIISIFNWFNLVSILLLNLKMVILL